MANEESPQARLDRIVRLIAAEMVAEVCSIYVRRGGDVLELFATEGLKQEAVHKTRLRFGEGLVGIVARDAQPLALAEAQSHPGFAYRPETGEEIYHSLMSVPILRHGRVLGVIVVQNRTARSYGDEEIEALETIAMVLAELIVGGGVLPPGGSDTARPARLSGRRLSPGLAHGHVWQHIPYIAIPQLVAEDPALERERLDGALSAVRERLDTLTDRAEAAVGDEPRDILEAYQLFARDSGWLERIREGIFSGLTAEAAISKAQDETRRRMAKIEDPYIRERLQDFDDLANRLLRHLLGEDDEVHAAELPDDAVVVARNLGPADLLEWPREKIRAVLLEEGSATAHVAIVARSLEIPVIGGIRNLFAAVDSVDEVLVDADNAQVFVRPTAAIRDDFMGSVAARQRERETYARMRDLPATTRDGIEIGLYLNAGFLIDMPHLDATGAAGIGLYRTELPFMVRDDYPDLDAQQDLYRRVLDQADERPVTFRTLDIGGDKPVSYVDTGRQENPAIGWRALRIGLDHPTLLRDQLRALIGAAADRDLRVMFPMVAEVAEFEAARAVLDRELERARRSGIALPSRVSVGAMLEVPALFWQLPSLLTRVDFLSVGSNDLLQFLFASDRENPRLADRYDPLSPAVLSFLKSIADQCRAANVPLTLCGEMAGRPLEALALVAAGYRNLSMTAAAVGPVKAMVREADAGAAWNVIKDELQSPARSLRNSLLTFAEKAGYPI